jgi:hypothetical protein
VPSAFLLGNRNIEYANLPLHTVLLMMTECVLRALIDGLTPRSGKTLLSRGVSCPVSPDDAASRVVDSVEQRLQSGVVTRPRQADDLVVLIRQHGHGQITRRV